MSGESAPVRPDAVWRDLHYDLVGLVTVVVQDVTDGQVLMLAHADREAVKRTVQERRAWFWSRSRQSLWRKGETSGNVLEVAAVRWDCDADALLYLVRRSGPVCHTGQDSCFFRGESTTVQSWAAGGSDGATDPTDLTSLGGVLDGLARTVAERARTRPEGSYVASLLAAGPGRALQKLGEEAVEAVLAGAGGDRDAAIGELADLAFHWLVACAALGIAPEAVAAELARRHQLRPPRDNGA